MREESAIEISRHTNSSLWLSEAEKRLRAERRSVIAALTIKSLSADRWAEGCLIQDRAYDESLSEDELSHRQILYQRLRHLDNALRSLSYGSYGLCSDCGGSIAMRRLLIDPAISRCLSCQAASESKISKLTL